MQLHEVGEVLEVFDVDTFKQKVADGWMLIAVVPIGVDRPMYKTACCYVLGKLPEPEAGEYVDGDWVPAKD